MEFIDTILRIQWYTFFSHSLPPPSFLSLKKNYNFCFKGRATQREGERKRLLSFTSSLSNGQNDQSCADLKARRQEFLGLSHRCRMLNTWAILQCLPSTLAGTWIESRATRTQVSVHTGFQASQLSAALSAMSQCSRKF